MGKCHQLFVIARVNGRYRTLCAIHHGYLCGRTALKRCLGTLKIFGDPANRIPLEQELIAAQRHDEGFWTATKDEYFEKNSHVPFPFIATCLITGASFGPDDGYCQGVLVESFYMAYNGGYNNNGITIFDITETSNVRYCFVDFHGMESERPVQLMTPLTARIYLEAYYELSDPQSAKVLLQLLNEFNEWNTIPVATLRDTWPTGEWKEPEFDRGDGDEVTALELKKMEISTPDTSKSLRDMAMATVLQALLDEPDESADLLSEAELLTDFLPKLKGKLYQQASALKPSAHLFDLLCRALEDNTDVDLSPFTAFYAEDMALVVSRLRKCGKMATLCISNRPDITEVDLRVVLHGVAGLEALYILEDPQILAQGMSMLLDECDLYNSDLLRRPINPQPERSYTGIESEVWVYNNVSQLAWIGITKQQAHGKSFRLESGLFDWKSLRQDKSQTNLFWPESYLNYKRYPLEMPLPTFKTVAGLLCLLNWGSSFPPYEPELLSRGAAFSFAMAPFILGGEDLGIGPVGVGNGFGIGSLGTALYLDSTYKRIIPSDAHERLEPGQWAIILVHEAFDATSQEYLDKRHQEEFAGAGSQPLRAIKRLRYALVTPSTDTRSKPSSHDFIVTDIPAYLEHTKGNDGNTQRLIKMWNSRIASINTVDFYGDGDIHEILPKVFPSQKAASSGPKPE